MRNQSHFWLFTASALISANVYSADLQQVAARCTSEGCCSDSRSEAGVWRNTGAYCHTGQCDNGYRYGDCDTGRCTMSDKWEACGLDWCGKCGPIGKAAQRGVPGARAICYCCNTKGSPDSGWSPPARLPVNRSGGGFQSYYPNNWYGNPGGGFGPGAPMVYQPTDTTQLGYSYATVPTWRRNPGMIPPVPMPSAFHTRACVGPNQCYGACQGSAAFHGGAIHNMCPHCPVEPMGNPMEYIGSAQPSQATQIARRAMQPAQFVQRNVTQPVPQSPTGSVKVRPVSNTVSQTASAPARQQSTRRFQQTRPRQASGAGSTGARRSPSGNSSSKKSGGWFGLPSLREMSF